MTDVRLPPQNLDAEREVLGAILLEPKALDVARDILVGSDFYYGTHRAIYDACCAVADRGEPVDVTTVSDQLGGGLESVGGRAGLAELLLTVATAVNVGQHCRIVKDKAQARALVSLAYAASERAYAGEPASELIEEVEQKLFQIGHGVRGRKFQALGQVLVGALDRIERLSKAGAHVTGITTGLDALDRQTAGLQNGDLVIIAARPSMGKTALALRMVGASAKAGKAAVVVSLEMSAEQLAIRLLAVETEIDVQSLRIGHVTPAGWHKLAHGTVALENLPVLIDDMPAASVSALCSSARRLRGEGKLDLLVIDYLQLMNPEDARGENRHRELAKITRACKLLAKELSVPVVLLSQLNRELERREDKKPMLADLRESGAIEEDADVIMFLYRPEAYHDAPELRGKAYVLIRKHRNGPTGDVEVKWIEHLATFVDAQ